jgi:hypothetical protein
VAAEYTVVKEYTWFPGSAAGLQRVFDVDIRPRTNRAWPRECAAPVARQPLPEGKQARPTLASPQWKGDICRSIALYDWPLSQCLALNGRCENEGSLVVQGPSTVKLPITELATNQRVGSITTVFRNALSICVTDLQAPGASSKMLAYRTRISE